MNKPKTRNDSESENGTKIGQWLNRVEGNFVIWSEQKVRAAREAELKSDAIHWLYLWALRITHSATFSAAVAAAALAAVDFNTDANSNNS